MFILDCQVHAVGKPVYNRNSNASFGSWMKDPDPSSSNDTIWMTLTDINTLLEFSNKTVFKNDTPSKTHTLNYPFQVSEIDKSVII